MRNLKKLLFAAALLAGAFGSTSAIVAKPPNPYCDDCALTGDCVSCCRCDGKSATFCRAICG